MFREKIYAQMVRCNRNRVDDWARAYRGNEHNKRTILESDTLRCRTALLSFNGMERRQNSQMVDWSINGIRGVV